MVTVLLVSLNKYLLKSICSLNQHHRSLARISRIYAMDQKRVMVFHEEDSGSVDISFRFVSETRKIDRIFNLQRKKEEGVTSVLARMAANISNAGDKKRKKNNDLPIIPVSVQMVEKPDVSDSMPPKKALPEDMTCYEAFVKLAMNHNLEINDESYSIEVNPPVVHSVDLPKCLMAGFPISVSKLKIMYAYKEQCIFKWYKSDLKFESIKDARAKLQAIKWLETGKEYFLATSNDDIGSLVKVVITPYLNDRKGEAVEAVANALVSAGPGECSYDRRHQHTKNSAGEKCLRVISYNILADLYASTEHARTHLFATCPPYALDIDYRKQLLLKEILGYNGDLLCLQEVDEKIFEYDLKPVLDKHGFDGYYDAKGGQVTEGVAVFCRRSKLRLLERSRFVLSSELQTNPLFTEMWEKLQCNTALKERVEQRSTTLQVSIFENVEDPSRLTVVGNTHLYFHPDADHIRILQGGICMQLLQQIICLYKAKNPEKDIGLLFCGDFNSTPEFGIYRFMTTQLIDTDDVDWTSCPEECIKGIEIHHDFEMDSACGCPPYTNYTVGFYGCLDYIFYQTDKFTVKKVIPMPAHEEVIEHVALPSITFPSDHIPLIADLEYQRG